MQGLPGFARRVCLAVCVFAVLSTGMLATARGQIVGGSSFPPTQYYLVFGAYYQGDYSRAFNEWKSAAGAMRIGTARFLDSCCYWTMAGECQYQTGNYANAIDLYDQSLRIYLDRTAENWQQRLQAVNIPNIRQNALQQTQINWGIPARAIRIPVLPDTMRIMFGDIGAVDKAVAQGGGVAIPPELKPVDVAEVMRCLALAIHHRHEIMGGVCKYQPLTLDVTQALEGNNVNDGTIMGAWNGVLLGLAYASIEDWDNAKTTLEQAVQFGQGLDHPLTPIALLKLAQISLRLGDANTAGFMALEASYSAAIYNQYDIMAEALSFGTMLHLATKKGGVYPPLENAILWSRKNDASAPLGWCLL